MPTLKEQLTKLPFMSFDNFDNSTKYSIPHLQRLIESMQLFDETGDAHFKNFIDWAVRPQETEEDDQIYEARDGIGELFMHTLCINQPLHLEEYRLILWTYLCWADKDWQANEEEILSNN